MRVVLSVRNASKTKRLYQREALARLAGRVCAGEGLKGTAELSLLLCDDAFIHELNRQYRGMDKPTDVLSFEQETPAGAKVRLLGDIVISLETVARFCDNNRAAMREELRLLFCHGLLHLLGYDHATAAERKGMQARQAAYLDVDMNAAWRERGKGGESAALQNERGGGKKRLGRR